MRFAAVIPVAGLSSRMGDFKPLMKLNGFAMIELCLRSFLDGGVGEIYVVLGHNSEQMREAIAAIELANGEHIWTLDNPNYATSDMLESVRLALAAIRSREADLCKSSCDAVFISPADMPAISARSVAALMRAARSREAVALNPAYDGKCGHPLLVRRECFAAIESHDGSGGLKSALAPYKTEQVPVEDAGILMDADTAADYACVQKYVRAHKGLAEAEVEALYERFQTPDNVRKHCRAVAALALRMALRLNQLGFALDSRLCYSAGLLHDLNRLENNHPVVAARNLSELGYAALADIVRVHQSLEIRPSVQINEWFASEVFKAAASDTVGVTDASLGAASELLTESNIVFLADKLVKNERIVTPDERYQPAMEKFLPDTEIGQRVIQELKWAKRLLDCYTKTSGDDLMAAAEI